MRVTGTKSTEDVLCNYCNKQLPTCPKATHIKFGNGTGNDNVIECSEFAPKRFMNNYPIKGMPELGIFKRTKKLSDQKLLNRCKKEIKNTYKTGE